MVEMPKFGTVKIETHLNIKNVISKTWNGKNLNVFQFLPFQVLPIYLHFLNLNLFPLVAMFCIWPF